MTEGQIEHNNPDDDRDQGKDQHRRIDIGAWLLDEYSRRFRFS